jgi:hypothetical protein
MFNFVCAQKYNSFAGLRLGGTLPMGEMASHDYGYGGYALLGRNIGAEAAWFVTPKLGFGIDISSNICGFAAVYYAEDYRENEPEFSKVDMLSGPYKIVTYMGGAYYKVSFSRKLSSTIKLMGGIFRARTPDQFYGVDTFGGIKLTFWKTGAYDTKFTFLTGSSFEYKLYEQVSLLLQADFTYAQMAFTFSRPSGSSSYTDHMHMPVFRLSPGININF